MKRIFINCCIIALLAFSVCISSGFAAGTKDLSNIETTNVDFDFAVLLNNQSTTVTADLDSSLSFEVIPVTLKGTGTFSASLARNNTVGELVYIFQWFPGVPATAFNIGVTPVTIRTSAEIANDNDELVIGFVFTGILISLEEPPFHYSVALGF